MSVRLVVFDFDGTLADSLASSVELFQTLGPKLGLKPFHDLDAARRMPTRKLLQAVGVNVWNMRRVFRAFHAAAAEHAPHLKLQPGIADLLFGLRDLGVGVGILSSNREDNIRACLRANGVEEVFGFVHGYPRLFGKGRAMKRILKRQRLAPADMLYVGDEVRDVEAARKVRVPIAAVGWGFHPADVLKTSGPTEMAETPGELLGLIARRCVGTAA